METQFFAKVQSINETQSETNTVTVIKENQELLTIRVANDMELDRQKVYHFDTHEIVFKEKEQLMVDHIVLLEDAKIDFSRRSELLSIFYNHAPVNMNDVKKSIESYLSKLENDVYKGITEKLFREYEKQFYLFPAATKFHHAYVGGLAHHTSTMLRLSDGFIEVYQFLNHELIISGILLHDLFKTVELQDHLSPEYGFEGRLIGHISMAVKAIEVAAVQLGFEKSEEKTLLEHMVLSHHYMGHFGSPKKPMIPEALCVHFIDNIDSKLTVVEQELEKVEEGTFTPPIPVADRERYYKPNTKKRHN